MGPLRFELRSEDPQSPRMARLPYGPAHYYWIISFIYLVIAKEIVCFGILSYNVLMCLTDLVHVKEIFLTAFLFPFYLSCLINRRRKEICIYVSIR